MTTRATVLVAALLVGHVLADEPVIAQGKCDRACLEGLADSYLAALAANDS